jgi:hypothetical protein
MLVLVLRAAASRRWMDPIIFSFEEILRMTANEFFRGESRGIMRRTPPFP